MEPVKIKPRKILLESYIKKERQAKTRNVKYHKIENINEIKAELPRLDDYIDPERFMGKRKCQALTTQGQPCQNYAVYGDDFCSQHGGEKPELVATEHLITDEELAQSYNAKRIFDPQKHPMAYIQLSYMGKSTEEIASIFQIGLGTLKQWAEQYESMYNAKEIGDTMYRAFWIETGAKNLENKNFNTNLYKFMTGNLIGFAEKTESKIHQTGQTGVLLIPTPPQTEEDWEKQVQEQTQILDMEGFDG